MTHSDEKLNYWGDRFVRSGLRRRSSITFEQFMAMSEARRERCLKFGEASRAAMATVVRNPVVRCRPSVWEGA